MNDLLEDAIREFNGIATILRQEILAQRPGEHLPINIRLAYNKALAMAARIDRCRSVQPEEA